MKRILLALPLLAVGPAFAADNAIVLTPGAGVTERSIDVGGLIQAPGVVPVSTTGAAIYGTAGAANANVLTVQGIASGFAMPISGAITANPTTAASWAIGATAAAVPANGIYNGMNVGGNLVGLTGTGTSLNVNCTAGCAGTGGTSSTYGATFPTVGTAIGVQSGANMIAWPAKAANTVATTDIVPEVAVANTNPNGRNTSANSSPIVPSAAPTPFHLVAAASNNATSVKASAATVMSCQLGNNSANIGYFKIYNKASPPAPATDNALLVFTGIVPGPAAGGGGSNFQFGPGGLTLGTGFAIAVVGGISDTDNTSVLASAFVVNCQYE
jgi:hypothetical protein